MSFRPVRATKECPWVNDPTGDVANAHAIPEDAGVCLLCFGDKMLYRDHNHPLRKSACPLCKGTGRQTPELVRAYKHGELSLDFLQTLA
ncbi:MAG: hypothetical protein U1E51_06810 [Candidatus Binatia bacterium]|nr:hypothetical protein [Candidatus Binatia bacterium]